MPEILDEGGSFVLDEGAGSILDETPPPVSAPLLLPPGLSSPAAWQSWQRLPLAATPAPPAPAAAIAATVSEQSGITASAT